MGAKHTPGPWQAAGKNIVQADGGVVAYVTAYGTTTPRQEANARLISAAPMLLEALQSLIRDPECRVTMTYSQYALARDAVDLATKGAK